MVVVGQKMLCLGKVVVFWQKLILSGKSGCIRRKLIPYGHKWFYSGKRDCIWSKFLYSGKSGCNRA